MLFGNSRAIAWIAQLAVASVTGIGVVVAAPIAAQAAQPLCHPYSKYKVTKRKADNFVKTNPTVQLYNHGDTTAVLTASIDITGSVSLSVSASVTVEAKAIVAGVRGTLGTTATATLSGPYTTSGSVTVKAHKWGYIDGGIFRGVTVGTYTHQNRRCQVFKDKKTVARTPYRFGYITSTS